MTEDEHERMDRLVEQFAEAKQECGQQQARAERAEMEMHRLAKEIAQIRGSLSQVAVYEGLIEVSPTAMMVAELVRDHEELEARIDATMHYLKQYLDHGEFGPVLTEVCRLLQGGMRIPDTPEGLS